MIISKFNFDVFLRYEFILLSLIILVEMIQFSTDDCQDIVMAKDEFFNDKDCLAEQGVPSYTELKSENWPFKDDLSPNFAGIKASLNEIDVPKEAKDIVINKTENCMEKFGSNLAKSETCKSHEEFSKCFSSLWDNLIEECNTVAATTVVEKKFLLAADIHSEIVRSWKIIAVDLKGNGVKFFIHFFKMFPKYQHLFSFVTDLDEAELAENKRLQSHSFNFLNYINGLINNINEIELFDELLHRTGRNQLRL